MKNMKRQIAVGFLAWWFTIVLPGREPTRIGPYTKFNDCEEERKELSRTMSQYAGSVFISRICTVGSYTNDLVTQ